jgi:hypothetical protein
MVVRMAGKRMYLWRAVDHEGEVLDMLVQSRRDMQAALHPVIFRPHLFLLGCRLLFGDHPEMTCCRRALTRGEGLGARSRRKWFFSGAGARPNR